MLPYSNRRQGTIRKGGSPYSSASLHICEHNGQLIAIFKNINNMKYGKITEGTLQTLEVEKGVQVGGKLTEEEIIAQGYKPVCEVEQPSDAEFCVYREYDVCFVQIWKRTDEEVQEDEIWTAESGVMPKHSDLERLKKDVQQGSIVG